MFIYLCRNVYANKLVFFLFKLVGCSITLEVLVIVESKRNINAAVTLYALRLLDKQFITDGTVWKRDVGKQ